MVAVERSNREPKSGSRSRKRSESIARDIVHDMRVSAIQPGQTLPSEAVMLEVFKVGRASLREALRILEVQGIVSLKPGPGGGPVVTARRLDEFADMLTLQLQVRDVRYRELVEARDALEPVIARLAAARSDDVQVRRLNASLDATERLPVTDFSALAVGWAEFHDILAETSGNGVLTVLSASLHKVYQARVVGLELREGRVLTDEMRYHNDHEHRLIAEAVAAGDADGAEALMRSHMERFSAASADRHHTMMDEIIAWE